ncbi:succinate dehydrogenase cytochrome b subunit [Microterricola viridarii]|uniref:succinate dehydrogenase cytochrome b subunit n=1 Tax=Microterricola viridarii TaxID=412690 RepID=UPI001F2E7062|nr:succinate dehydrogenase cytochrome b subunit [Microterricola viridarii]
MAPPGRRPLLSNFALKIIMAVTGLVFAGFVLVHMIGNLKVYQGPEHFNAYAVWLRTLLEPLFPYEGVLWALRIVLIVCLVGHVGGAAMLVARARRARGPFRRKRLPMRSFLARTMPVTGVVLLLFVIFHLLDLTTGTRPAASASFEHGTVDTSHAYENLIASFQRPEVALFYILAMVLLGMHLAHGLWTAAHDLGATGKRLRAIAVAVAGILAIAIMLGNISIPVAVLLGVVQ